MKILQVAVAIDQLLNTLCGGYADETMSSRCWRLRAYSPYKWLRPAIDTILFFDPDHCRTSYESEVARKYLPTSFSQPE